QRADADLLRLRSGRARRARQQPRRGGRRHPARPVSAKRELPGRRHLRLGCGVHCLHLRPAGAARRACQLGPAATGVMDTEATQQATAFRTARVDAPAPPSMLSAALPFLALLVIGLAFPLFGGGYWGVIATRACVYWVLVSGLNLVVGFAGQIAIG